MIDKAHGYGYRNIGFILDRGYFSKSNLEYMEKNGYSFLIMVKGMKDFIREIVIEKQGSFENSRGKYIDRYDLYGTTVRHNIINLRKKWKGICSQVPFIVLKYRQGCI